MVYSFDGLRPLGRELYSDNGHFRLTPLRHANKSGVCEVPHSIQNQPAGVIVPVCCSGVCGVVVEQAEGEVGGWKAPLVDKQSARLLWLTFKLFVNQRERRIRPIRPPCAPLYSAACFPQNIWVSSFYTRIGFLFVLSAKIEKLASKTPANAPGSCQ